MIKYGTTRMVWILPSHVVKIPRLRWWLWRNFLLGLLGNLQEADFFAVNGNNNKFCPVVFCLWGGWLLIMKRATPLTDKEFHAIPERWWQSNSLLASTEKTISSVGRYEGRVVAIDYGAHPLQFNDCTPPTDRRG